MEEENKYKKTFLQADSYDDAKDALAEVYEANPDAIIIVEEEGKECLIEHGKELRFLPSNVNLGDINEIKSKIPSQASSDNQLADKDFVNSSISTSTAEFKGTHDTLASLQGVSADANDYGFVVTKDSDGNTVYKRYKYVEGTGWVWEYDLNNSSFTADQWASIQSQITKELVDKLRELPAKSEIETLKSTLNELKAKVEQGGSGGIQAPPSDGSTYGYCNGEWVRICLDGYRIQIQSEAQGMTLQAKAGETLVKTLMSNVEQSKTEENG